MLNHLKEKKEVGFFTSISGLMSACSVLDLDAFERNTKAEGLGVGSEGAAGEKNMHDAEFTCALFRFIQLTCEGHNLGELVNILISLESLYFVDSCLGGLLIKGYSFVLLMSEFRIVISFRLAELFEDTGWKYDNSQCCHLHSRLLASTTGLRLLLIFLVGISRAKYFNAFFLSFIQESIMDFYWHYSSKELIDPAGKANFFKAIGVASQVFNTLTEVIQGPCSQNQQALAHSRYASCNFQYEVLKQVQ